MRWKHVSVRETEGIERIVIASSNSVSFESVKEQENDCWLRNVAPSTFTVYTSDSSKRHKHEHRKNVDECMLRVMLQTPELDQDAHFLILSAYNTKAKRFESHVVLFSDMQCKTYQQNLLCGLQNECELELIHCSCDIIHSPHWWIQKQFLDYITDVNTVYSNCHYCLAKAEILYKW